MNRIYLLLMSIGMGIVATSTSRAACVGCQGDVGVKLTAEDFWGEVPPGEHSKHAHEFGPLCDATDLVGFTGEVHISIVVSADLYGGTKWVTANFVSGTNVTPITSGNGFVNAPADGKFFVKTGQTACAGEENIVVLRVDYDVFNALLAQGDGTMTIEVIASDAVQELCDICCETGHPWTPDPCCSFAPPCCPPERVSYTEVSLVYLDCDVWSIAALCTSDEECQDGLFCNGEEICNEDGACEHTGNPCLATGRTCDEAIPACVDCDYWGDQQGMDAACAETDGVFCNGAETCDTMQTPAVCVPGTPPCLPEDCYEEIFFCLGCTP